MLRLGQIDAKFYQSFLNGRRVQRDQIKARLGTEAGRLNRGAGRGRVPASDEDLPRCYGLTALNL